MFKSLLVALLAFFAASSIISPGARVGAQAPPVSSAPGEGLVVGAGNFFSPIVSNLEKGIAFYRDGLGLEVTAPPSNADENAPLRDMFGLSGAKLRWTIARPAGMRSGVEIIEVTQANGHPLDRRVQDPGAMTLIRPISDLGAVLVRLNALGAVVVSKSGKPVTTDAGAQMVLVREPDGHFVELFAVARAAGPGEARVRLTVSSVDRAVALYRDALGLRGAVGKETNDSPLMNMLGVNRGKTRIATLEVPGSPVVMEFIEFSGIDRRTVRGNVQDPGSTRMQLQVRDLDAAMRAVERAGGAVISAGGKPVDLPAGRGNSIRAAMVRDPDNLFLVLIEAARPPP